MVQSDRQKKTQTEVIKLQSLPKKIEKYVFWGESEFIARQEGSNQTNSKVREK